MSTPPRRPVEPGAYGPTGPALGAEPGYGRFEGPGARSRVPWKRAVVASFVIAVCTAASLYLALIVAARIDTILLPGQDVVATGGLGRVGLPLVERNRVGGVEDRINILILGLDRREDVDPAGDPGRADTFQILTVDPFNKTARLLAIPRDTWVAIPDAAGAFENRINTAYTYGELHGHPGGGPGLAKDTVEENFGVGIDYYVVIDFEGFTELIDAVGGIDLHLPDTLCRPADGFQSPLFDALGVGECFVPGRRHLNGAEALAYSRIRADSDFERAERQQRVMLAAAETAASLGYLGNAPEVYSRYRDSVRTDVPAVRVAGLALLARDIGLGNVETFSLADALSPYTTAGGAAVQILDPAKAEEILARVFTDPREEAEARQAAGDGGTG